MYRALKNIFLLLTPSKFIEKHQFHIRKVYSFLFWGSKVKCSVCENTFQKFIIINENDTLCARCGSIPRQRLLWLFLQKEKLHKNKTLHFSPNPYFAKSYNRKCKEYVTSEYETVANTDLHLDITSMDLASNSFDCIICYHILEHITEDSIAMKELHRVLNKKGILILQVPFNKTNKTKEDSSIKTPEERLIAFGQEDHVRIYGKDDFKNRLSHAGFNVKEITTEEIASEAEISGCQLNKNEVIILCSK